MTRIDNMRVAYEAAVMIQVGDKSNGREDGEEDKWTGQKYIYRWNEDDLVIGYILEMRKRKESMTAPRFMV